MNDNTPRSIIPSQKNALEELTFRAKLIWRLMGDRRVSPFVKLLPVGALIYLISPIDAIMGIPGVSALDDMGILWLGSYFFIELCPTDVIQEHVREMTNNNTIVDEGSQGLTPGDVIDGEATDIKD
ncbi:MAG: DUF1232 domain-containing protein [Anaerolineae bacterium]|nr:DUF1232 domain-containing protein [Anaerolineae bacterium]